MGELWPWITEPFLKHTARRSPRTEGQRYRQCLSKLHPRFAPSHITNLAFFIKPAPFAICDLSFPVLKASLRCRHELPFPLALGPRVKHHI